MRKKFISITLVLALAFSNSICVSAAEKSASKNKITIIHTNDTHARVLSDDGGFGFAKIASLVKKEKAENPNTLLIDAGDTFHGKPIINISKGENAVKILNATGYDFMTPGNHDFNYGVDRLIELGKESDFKILSSNIEYKDGNRVFDEYEIVDMNGLKVGIFGLTTPETAIKTNPKNVEGIEFEDPIEASKEIVDKLEDKTDVIVAIAHVGLDESSCVTSKEIAEKVKGIDVIIDGHSHTKLDSGLAVGDTLIAQTGEYDQNIGKVDIEVDDHKVVSKKAELLKSEDYKDLAEDKNVKSVIENIQKENDTVFSQLVAKTDIDLDGARENVRSKETNLGNLAADAMKYAAGTDIGFVNGGGIRTSIPKGDITQGKVAELFPFGNIVESIKLKGADVKRALEVSVDSYPELKGGFLQVSGVTFDFDLSKAAGNRVENVKVNGDPIDTNKEYTVAINDFLAEGGDGFDMFKTNIIAQYGGLEEAFAQYLNSNGTKNCDVTGRIKVKEGAVKVPEKAEVSAATASVQANPLEQYTISNTQQIVPQEIEYVVESGDYLSKIAAEYSTTWDVLADYNNILNPDIIYPGQVIKIPA